MINNLIKNTLILILTLSITSCLKDEDLVCNETVTGYYLETYTEGYYYGYGQYTVFTIDNYGYTYTYTDATKIPSVGICW